MIYLCHYRIKSISDTILRNLFLSVFIPMVCVGCGSVSEASRDFSLKELRNSAKRSLEQNIEEFNNYTDRPKSDGNIDETNNKEFLVGNIPYFQCSDSNFNKVYNYRWWMISKHLKKYRDEKVHKDYWVFTEFFGPRPWASRSDAITCPAGHQFYDIRWLKDPTFAKSYAEYYMQGSAATIDQRENENFLTYQSRPESVHFSSWMIDGVEALLKIHPDQKWMREMLPAMESHQRIWDSLFMVDNPASKTSGMYRFLDLYDGMEFSLSAVLGLIASDAPYAFYTEKEWRTYYLGWNTTPNAANTASATQYPQAFRKGYPDFYLVRPTLNCYVYGNLTSLSTMYELLARSDHNAKLSFHKKAKDYDSRAKSIRKKVLEILWNDEDQFFNSYTAGDNKFGIRDYEARVRESVGYTPWYFGLVPSENSERYAPAWKWFSSSEGFNNSRGMTTAEQRHPYYNEQAYAWNGRGWPFQNSVVNKAFANYLKHYKSDITDQDKQLLYAYIEKLVVMHGEEPNIGEWYIPSDGTEFGGEKDYFHSTFPDMIISDLLGFEPFHKSAFALQPLLPNGKWSDFYLGNLSYHGHVLDIAWKKDWDPDLEGNQSELRIWIDGRLIQTSKSIDERIWVDIAKESV